MEDLSNYEKLKNKLKSYFNKNSVSFLNMIGNCDQNTKQFEKSDSIYFKQDEIDSQLKSEDVLRLLTESGLLSKVENIEKEIIDEEINDGLKIHGPRHIKDVLLYSALVGQSVFKDEHDLELIMIAAKFHDVGRITEGREAHAEPSARIAVERLKDSYSREDLAIIKTLIEFHEVPRNLRNIDDIFYEMAIRNGVSDEHIDKVRQMAEVIKDADALDRTRFINRARLEPYYLYFDISKKLVKFASSLQETYAILDLKAYQCDKEIDALLEFYTPQEILRTIRHSVRQDASIKEVQDFIVSYASSKKYGK